jgi:hypothetical protein
MKKIVLLLLLTSLNILGQSIKKKDGGTVDVSGGQIHVEAGNKRLAYILKDSKKPQYIKFNELVEATLGDFVFRTFVIDGKEKAYYVVAQGKDKTLVTIKRTRTKSRGGFETAYTHFELAVIDKQNKALEELTFTDVNNDKQIGERGKIIPMIKSQFFDCPKLIEKISAFESPSSDTKNETILVFLNDPVYVKCE